MKKLLGLIILCLMFTGCAQMQDNFRRSMLSNVDLAKEDCSKMGFTIGTPQYQNCVMINTQNIRNNRATVAAAQAMAPQYYGPTTTTCSQVGSYIQCR